MLLPVKGFEGPDSALDIRFLFQFDVVSREHRLKLHDAHLHFFVFHLGLLCGGLRRAGFAQPWQRNDIEPGDPIPSAGATVLHHDTRMLYI
jgi:hypothetical protein